MPGCPLRSKIHANIHIDGDLQKMSLKNSNILMEKSKSVTRNFINLKSMWG